MVFGLVFEFKSSNLKNLVIGFKLDFCQIPVSIIPNFSIILIFVNVFFNRFRRLDAMRLVL